MQVSNAKLKTYRRCPNQYKYKYVWGLRPKHKRVQLERGSWLHELLMTHYDGEDWRVKHLELKKKFLALWDEEREELGDLPTECARIMRSYLRTYADDAERYRVIDSELNEVVTLPNGLRLNIVVDLIVEDLRDGGLWLWDHKTRKNFSDASSMMIDPQLTLYFWSLERMGYTPLRGAMYNEIRTKAPAVPGLLKSGQLSQRTNIDTDIWTYMGEIKRRGLDPVRYTEILHHIAGQQKDRFFRRTSLPKDPPVVKTTMIEAVQTAQEIQAAEHKQRFPRTFDISCNWGCDFKDLCIAELHGADPSSIIRMNFEEKNGD